MVFTGRDEDIEWLDQQWQDAETRGSGALLVLAGTGGVGKSALATQWLDSHAEDFPDGQLYVDLGSYSTVGQTDPAEALAEFLRALGMAPERIPTGFAERAAALRTATHGLRLGVLIDSAFTAAQVRTLALTSPGCVTVVSTRETLTGLMMDGARLRRLTPWQPRSALAYVERVLGEQRVAHEPQAAQRVVELCGGLPLALAVAAARLASRPRWTIARLAEDLAQDGRQRLEVLKLGQEGSAVTPVLDGSYRLLAPDSAHLYRILGSCPVAWFDLAMVAALLGCTAREAEERIDVLVDANLLEDLGLRYRFHDLVRLHAEHCAALHAAPEEATEALWKLCDYYLSAATRAEELLTPSHRLLARSYRFAPPPAPFDDREQALNWLDRQRQNLMTVLRRCADQNMHATVWQLVDAMWPLFTLRGHMKDRIDAQMLAVAATEADSDEIARASALTQLAGTLGNAGRLGEAAEYCSRALAAYERLGDERGTAQAMNGLAKIYLRQGELERAQDLFGKALGLRRKIGYRRGSICRTRVWAGWRPCAVSRWSAPATCGGPTAG
jgi:tetratricopeptide (TPR) repeat protein